MNVDSHLVIGMRGRLLEAAWVPEFNVIYEWPYHTTYGFANANCTENSYHNKML